MGVYGVTQGPAGESGSDWRRGGRQNWNGGAATAVLNGGARQRALTPWERYTSG